MMVMMAAALLTITVLIILLAPLMLGSRRQKWQGWLLLVMITLTATGLYLWRGAPQVPSAPALFENEGPRFDKRQAVGRELQLVKRLVQSPEDVALMLEIGNLRLKNGRIDHAVAILSKARKIAPDNATIRERLGAAHYAAALAAILLEDDRESAAVHFKKALTIAPLEAPYREKLQRDFKKLQEET